MNNNFIKSASGVVTKTVEILQDRLLGDNEILDTNPASFVNQILSLGADMTENITYELLSNMREISTTDAILKSSLMGKLIKSKGIDGVFGKPANITFVVGFNQDELMKVAMPYDVGVRRLVLHKGLIVQIMNKPLYRTTNDIEILFVDNNGVTNMYAKFIKDPLSSMDEQNIILLRSDSIIIDNTNVFFMYIPMVQYESKEYEYMLTRNEKMYKYSIDYASKLINFDVLYKEGDKDWIKLPGVHEGSTISNGYLFSLKENIGVKKLNIRFSQSPNMFSPADNSRIKIILYMTDGTEGNFKIPSDDVTEVPLTINLNQDTNDEFQAPLGMIKPIISVYSTESINGEDEADLTKIRTLLLDRSNGIAITPQGIEHEIRRVTGFDSSEYNFDITLGYMAKSLIELDAGEILPTLMKTINFDIQSIPIKTDTNSRIISPSDVFNYGTELCEYNPNPGTYLEYLESYENFNSKQFQFPFHIRLLMGRNIFVNVYDMARNETPYISFKYFNSKSYSEINVIKFHYSRQPNDIVNKDKYVFTFDVRVNDTIIQNLLVDPSILDVKLKFDIDNDIEVCGTQSCSIVNISEKFKTVSMKFEMTTNNSITNDDNLCIDNYDLVELPRLSTTTVEKTFFNNFNVDVVVLIKGNENITTPYDLIRTDADVLNNRFIASIYRIEGLSLLTNITNKLKIVSDLKQSYRTFKYYDETIYKMYLDNVYEHDENGDLTLVETIKQISDNESIVVYDPILLHTAGEYVVDDSGEKIVEHLKGDALLDSTGQPIIDEEVEVSQYCRLRNVLLYDRVYSHKFQDVRDNYLKVVNDLSSIQSIDGCDIYMGICNTTGVGPFVFTNTITGVEEYINDMALSFDLGVRLENKVNLNKEEIVSLIVLEIKRIILSYDNTSILSINELLDTVKSNVPNIKSFVVYSINNYSGGICQEIRVKDDAEVTDDKLCIKHKLHNVDGEIISTPDINIQVLD